MARQKSTSGGKANRTTANRTTKEQTNVNNPATLPDVNSVAAAQAAPAEIKPESRVTVESKVPSETRKFELRKTELRKNVVPINLENEIRRRAYELYQQREPGTGNEAEDWLIAEREVMQRYHQQSA